MVVISVLVKASGGFPTRANAQLTSVPPAQPTGGNGNQVVFNLGLPGQYYDRETGLYYNSRRDYNPTTGRYMQPDPVAKVRASVYGYANNNPVRFVDPKGLETEVLRSEGPLRGIGPTIPHVAYRVYDEVNGRRMNDFVYTNDSTNNFHVELYEQYRATHNIVEMIPLHTSHTEDDAFRDFYFRNQDLKYNFPFRDCATVTGRAINVVRPRLPRAPEQPLPGRLADFLHARPFPTAPSGGYQDAPGFFSCVQQDIPGTASGPACGQ